MLYLWIIIIVVLIYLSFSCYESFATTPKAKAKSTSNTSDLITNSLSVLNNGSVNGNFNVKGNFITDGASTFKNGIDVNGYLRLNGQDVTNNQNIDLSQYVRQDNLASIISSLPSMNNSNSISSKNDVILDLDKKYCIADSCITKADIDKLKSLSSTPSS